MKHSFGNNIPRYCILILGMHRSGTSATSGCLSILGYQLGKRIVPPGKPNIKGYFENNSINRFNEDLLDILNARWNDTMHLPDKWWKDDRLISYKIRLKEILYEEFGSADNFVIKDPRISVLLPIYSVVFQELNILTKVIINFRNPIEVALSLKKRDNLSLSKSLLLWMDATLKAEELTREIPRLFLHYNSLLANPFTSIQQINNKLELHQNINNEIKIKIESFVEAGLKHHYSSSATENEEIPKLPFQLYELLKSINFQNTAHQNHDIFDKIRNQFYLEFRFFNGIDKVSKIRLKTLDNKKNVAFYSDFFSENNEYSFSLKPSGLISEFWIYPTNQRTSLQLSNLEVLNEEGDSLPVSINETNAEKVFNNGLLIFESETPWIKIKLKTVSILSKINLKLHFFGFSTYAYRSSVKEKQGFEKELLGRIDLLQKDFNQVNEDHINTVNNLEVILYNLQKETEELVIYHQFNIKTLDTEKTKQEQEYYQKERKLKADNTFLNHQFQSKEEELQLIKHSKSWRFARLITWPIRILKL